MLYSIGFPLREASDNADTILDVLHALIHHTPYDSISVTKTDIFVNYKDENVKDKILAVVASELTNLSTESILTQ